MAEEQAKLSEQLLISFPDALYMLMRNYLVHQGKLSPDVVLKAPEATKGWSISFDENGRFVVGDRIIDMLFQIVMDAPENVEFFDDKG